MKKLIVVLSAAICLFAAIDVHAQTKLESPEEFLGYQLGSKFTFHSRIVDYFKYVADNTPNIKIQQYGTTNEGRPLMIAIIASPENFSRLDQIRQSNMSITGLENGQVLPDQPVICWLSYNVHGNEPASSEAAMKVLYTLASKSDPRINDWLKNTVVIMDPCLNPDGRDRFADYYNHVANTIPDATPWARQHTEPWPGGRVNHYYFDLNRDWVWQVQKETQERLKLYNSWLPEIHVDYHEQGYNAPYYFAPAADPFHEVITPWEKAFQDTIGHNHAKYFGKNGWLFFTKRRFDLFYPSYGDTYPLYNGAIGMTYEQGGIRAGIAIKTADGDTLTLAQRLLHHYTTSISTIEMASAHANELLDHFKQYYAQSRDNPDGDYNAYVIKGDNPAKLQELAKLLKGNRIQFGYGSKTGSASGFNYFTGNNDHFNITDKDMVINAHQPKSTLLKVLFEPKSKLTDSITYDISAWAVPYSYGLQAYALKDNITYASEQADTSVQQSLNLDHPYAYIVPWKSIRSAQFMTYLLQHGIQPRYEEIPFEINNIKYDPGTLIITRAGNAAAGDQFDNIIVNGIHQFNLPVSVSASGLVQEGDDFGTDRVHLIKKPHVVLIGGEGVSSLNYGEVWFYFEQVLHYPVTTVMQDHLNDIPLDQADVLILPDGHYKIFNDSTELSRLKEWIRNGGRLIAMEDAVKQIAQKHLFDISVAGDDNKDKDTGARKDIYEDVKPYAGREREEAESYIPGSIFKVQMDTTNPLAFGYPGTYYTLKEDTMRYAFLKDGWNVGILKDNPVVSGFVGAAVKSKMKNALLFGVEDLGRGEVIYIADDPLFRGFWKNGELMFSNAVFLVGAY